MKPINIKATLYESRVYVDGTHPICIWINSKGKRKVVTTGISVQKKQWDKKNGRVKNHPMASALNIRISEILSSYQSADFELQKYSPDSYSINKLVDQVQKPMKRNQTVLQYFSEIVERNKTNGKPGNARVYSDTRTALKNFTKGKDIQFADLTPSFLGKFRDFLRSKGVGDVTLHFYFRTIRSLYNKAIEEDYATEKNYPFKKFKLSQFNTKTNKRAISKEEVYKVLRHKAKKENRLALDYFKFAYYSGGINFVDFAKLKWSDVDKDHISYKRSKTGQSITFTTTNLEKILDYYRDEVIGKSDYIFPVLSEVHDTASKIHNRIHKVRNQINQELKEIGEKFGIKNLTTYVARHSAATILRDAGASLSVISQTLGHTNLKTTQVYLAELDQSTIDDALLKL